MRPARTSAGFTLLEVIIAVAILGISLTAIFGGEAGAARTAYRSSNYLVATSLARCKIGELREIVFEEGLPAIEKHGIDNCCEDTKNENFECEWSIERIKLADYITPPEETDTPLTATDGDEGHRATAATDGFDPQQLINQSLTGNIDTWAMGIAYPILEPAIEHNVRLVKLNMTWQEFGATKSMNYFTYFVAGS